MLSISLKSFFEYILILGVLLFISPPKSLAQHVDKDSLIYYKKKLINQDKLPLDSLMYYYKKAISFANDTIKANLLRKEARYLFSHNFKKAGKSFFQKALSIAKSNHIQPVEARIYHDMGYSYYMLNNYYEAYKYFLKAKKMFIQLDDVQNLHIVNSNIATLLLDEDKNYNEAEKIYREELAYYIKTGDSLNILYAKLDIAHLTSLSESIEKGIQLFKEIENDPHWDKEGLSLVNYNLAINFKSLKQYHLANKYIDTAINYSKQIDDQIQLIDLYRLKSEIESTLGNYLSAKKYIHLSLASAKLIEDLPFQIVLYKLLIANDIKFKKYDRIPEYFNKLNGIQDSLDQREKLNSYQEAFLKNQLEEKEELARLQASIIAKETRQKRLYLVLILFGLFAFSVLGLLFYLSKMNYKKSLKLEEQKIKIREIETQRIQSELQAKKRELLISLLFTRKRKEKQKSINKEIDRITEKSIIDKTDLLNLKAFVTKKANELDEEENVQQKLVNTHKDFFNKLLKDYPDLSKTELKILAYLRIGLTTKEIADIQYVSVDAIRKSRYRIRKKLHLDASVSLEKLILQFY